MKKHALCILILISIVMLTGCGKKIDSFSLLTERIVSGGIADNDMRTDGETVNGEMAGRLYGTYAVSADGIKFYQYNAAEDLWEPMSVESNSGIGMQEDLDAIASLYQELFNEITESDTIGSIEATRNIIRRLGEHGYAAVDSANQIDMVEKEQVLQFCESVEKQETDELTILVADASGSYTEYDLSTAEGQVEVAKSFYQYSNDCFEKKGTARYAADSWQYTKEGYLIFTGSHYSEESYVLTMSDVPEVTALRVEPLDAQCREWNRRYILPIGYGRNNMFLSDWSEDDYGSLDFYDVFDRFYPTRFEKQVPYTADENINIGAVYQIPEDEFEKVVMMHFPIDCKTLRAKTKYLSEEGAYEYRPRGFYEVEYPNLPYPEVVGYTMNDDGTMTLIVNAVYPNERTSRAFTHEVVIRLLENDGFQYVSNTVMHAKDDYGTGWHTDRLTEEEWEEIYGEIGL